MKISVLLYLSGMEERRKLYGALVSAGFRVCGIGNLSRLHTVLESHSFDAVLVHKDFFTLHGMSASRHLWESRSSITIIEGCMSESGTLSFKVHGIPPSVSGVGPEKDHERKLALITEMLAQVNLRANRKLNPAPGDIAPAQPIKPAALTLPPEITLALHKKILLVLETIYASGADGADTQYITERVWGKDSRNRTKDIQSYVCKLRKRVCGGSTPYAIRYENRRYYLTENSGRKPGA